MARLPFSGGVDADLARKLQDARKIDLLHFDGDRLQAFKAVLFTYLLITVCGAVIPNQYYVNVSWDDHTVNGIKTLLGDGFTIPYEVGVFDCSEMSAYVEWLLQCHGFDAGFCMDGTGPWVVPGDPGYSSHMWVAVRLWNDTTGVYEGLVYIEPTSKPIKIIGFTDPEWSKYARDQEDMFLGMKNFLSIYDAIEGITPNTGDSNSLVVPEAEVDWWTLGSDLIKKPVPVKVSPFQGITAEDIRRLRDSVAAVKPVHVGTFRTTAPKKGVTFKTT